MPLTLQRKQNEREKNPRVPSRVECTMHPMNFMRKSYVRVSLKSDWFGWAVKWLVRYAWIACNAPSNVHFAFWQRTTKCSKLYVAMRVPDQCEQRTPFPCNCVSILYDVNQNMTVMRIRSIAWNMFAQNSFHFISFRFIQVWMALVVSWYGIVLLKHIVMHIQHDYPFRSFSRTLLCFWCFFPFHFKYFSIEVLLRS